MKRLSLLILLLIASSPARSQHVKWVASAPSGYSLSTIPAVLLDASRPTGTMTVVSSQNQGFILDAATGAMIDPHQVIPDFVMGDKFAVVGTWQTNYRIAPTTYIDVSTGRSVTLNTSGDEALSPDGSFYISHVERGSCGATDYLTYSKVNDSASYKERALWGFVKDVIAITGDGMNVIYGSYDSIIICSTKTLTQVAGIVRKMIAHTEEPDPCFYCQTTNTLYVVSYVDTGIYSYSVSDLIAGKVQPRFAKFPEFKNGLPTVSCDGAQLYLTFPDKVMMVDASSFKTLQTWVPPVTIRSFALDYKQEVTIVETYDGTLIGLEGIYPASTASIAQENAQTSFAVYPNPSSGIVHVRSPEAFIIVKDVLGRSHTLLNRNGEVDLSGLPSSTYSARIVGDDGKARTIKIVKN